MSDARRIPRMALRRSTIALLGRAFRSVLLAGLGCWLAVAGAGPLGAQARTAEHRVVVATGESDLDSDVEASLQRQVNRLAAAGFEVAAIMGGAAPVIDQLLGRKPYVAGLVDHGGQIVVVMRRTADPAVRREYRLLHTRGELNLDEIVSPLGAQGFVLAATAHDGPVFHAAFERRGVATPVSYRVVRNRGRNSWMDQVQKDPAMTSRLRRVVPMALDHALVELGDETSPAGALEWANTPAFRSDSLEATLNSKAAAGFRVQLVRLRENTLDVLLVRPAGPAGAAASYDVDDGPWGGPCSRGTLVGAAGYTDGEVYCVAENPGNGVSNRGFDGLLRVRTGATMPLLDVPSCVDRARLRGPRPAHARIAVAQQLERFLDAKVPAGFRLTRLLAVPKAGDDARLVAFTSNAPVASTSGPPSDTEPVPPLVPELDGPLSANTAQRQRDLNERLARLTGVENEDAWLDVIDRPEPRGVVLSGCVRTQSAKTDLERAVRLMLPAPFAGYRFRSDVIVELFR
jgi:hypothetical protein